MLVPTIKMKNERKALEEIFNKIYVCDGDIKSLSFDKREVTITNYLPLDKATIGRATLEDLEEIIRKIETEYKVFMVYHIEIRNGRMVLSIFP